MAVSRQGINICSDGTAGCRRHTEQDEVSEPGNAQPAGQDSLARRPCRQLPMHMASSIFVRHDDDRMNKVRAMITGDAMLLFGKLLHGAVLRPAFKVDLLPCLVSDTVSMQKKQHPDGYDEYACLCHIVNRPHAYGQLVQISCLNGFGRCFHGNLHASVIPSRKCPFSSDQGSQTGLGLTSVRLSDHPGTSSADAFVACRC